MTERILPGIGLTGYWDQGAPWKVGGDQNWLRSSVLTQLAVESATTSLPASPLNGVIYIVPVGDANANQVAARDNGAWVYMPPQEGWTAYVRDAGVLMNFDGAAWVPSTQPLASDLAANSGATQGATRVGYDGGTSQDVLDNAKVLQDYVALRAYAGRATGVRITGVYTALPAGIAGQFQLDAADTTSTDNDGTIIVDALSRRWKRIFDDAIIITWFGAKTDGSDALPAIQKALDLVALLGSGKILIPYTTEIAPFCISDTIKLWNNTTLICDGWLKIIGDTSFDAAVSGVAGAVDWSVYGLKVDANFVPAQGGLYWRRNNTGVFVDRIIVKNAVHDTTTKGGRAFTSEAGVDPANAAYVSRKSYIGSIIAINCYCAASIQGGGTNAAPNLVIGSIIGENCQNLLMAFGNSAGYPFSGAGMQAVIGEISGYNCGVSTSYSRRQGIINSDRGCNISIGQVSVVNTDAYIDAATYPPSALFLGDFNGWQVGQAFVDSKGLTAAISFSRFDEANSIGGDTFESYDNDFNISLRQACVYTLVSSLSADAKVQRTRVRLTIKEALTGATILPSQMQAKTTTWLDLMYWPQNARITGFCSRIAGATPTQYATVDADLVSDRRYAVAYDAPSLVVGAATTLQTTAATGARVGEIVTGVFAIDPQGVVIRAWVSVAGTISWYAYNPAANPVGTVDLGATTVRFYVQPVL